MPFGTDPFADHPLVQDYYSHQLLNVENIVEIEMRPVEITINGKGPFLAFVTNQFAKRNEPGDVKFDVQAEVWPPK